MQFPSRIEEIASTGDDGLHRGPWAEWEDELLVKYVAKYGEGNWASVKEKPDIGLKRCGKSCRLRFLNHLKPGLKKGAFSEDEEDLIFTLHTYYGNKWSRIALELPGRTDNEIKNFYHYKCKKLENARLPVPGQSAEDKARAHDFVQSRMSTEELSINLAPREPPPTSLLGKRDRADTPDRDVKFQKTDSARPLPMPPPPPQQGNSNITLRVPIIGPSKPLQLGGSGPVEKAVLVHRTASNKNLESAGKLAQSAINAARATASAGGRVDDAARVAAAALHRSSTIDTKPSDTVTNLMTGVARLAAEAVLPRVSSTGFDLGGGASAQLQQQLQMGFLPQQRRLELLAQLHTASEQKVAALFPASPVSILDVAQLDPHQRQLLEARVRTLLAGRREGDALNRQASEPARLDVLRQAMELEAAWRGAGVARPLDQVEQTLERAEAFLRPKQEVDAGGVGAQEHVFDRQKMKPRGAWREELLRQGGAGPGAGTRGSETAPCKTTEGASPLCHIESVAKEAVSAKGREDGGSIGSEDIRTQDSSGSLLGPKMRAFKELRRPQLDVLSQGEDPEPGPLTAAVGRHLSPSESTARTPAWLWSPRLSAGRKKWAGPIWKTVNGHSVDISELSPDYVSELWGLDAETFACKTPTLSLFPGAISDDEAFSLSDRGPSTSRSPSTSDGPPWLPWLPLDGKVVTRDEVSGKLVSPRTVMEAIESGPLSSWSPRELLESPSDGQLTSLGSSRGSGRGAHQWWLSLIGTPRESPTEEKADGASRVGGTGDLAAGEAAPAEGKERGEGGGGLVREASLRIEGKVDEAKEGVLAAEDAWPSLKGKHRPTSSFTFSTFAPPGDQTGAGEEQRKEETPAESAPESGLTGGSPQAGSMLEQVRSLFTRPS